MKATGYAPAAIGAVLLLPLGACKPDIGKPPSLVEGPRLLALRQTPPEVTPGATASFDALVADPTGTVAAPMAWTLCKTPRPPTESNSVSQACVAQPDDDVAMAGPVALAMPSDACSLFGPDPPPVTPPIRPRDPDATGGFYVPVRAATQATDGTNLVSFAFERIQCNLASAPGDVARMYNMTYMANRAPVIADVVLDPEGAAPASLIVGAGGGTIAPGTKVTLRLSWAPEAAETYILFDPTTRTLVTPREALRVSWFATDGELEHDRTGRTGEESDLFTDDVWTAPADAAPGTAVHFWVVLRDERGGVDFAAFDLVVGI
jgi:hypothetical protein